MYKRSVRIVTRATSFSLVYGGEVVLPLELEISSLRISLRGDTQDEDDRKVILQQLEALDEKLIHAIE